MDNLFLVRDIVYICNGFNVDVGLVALDQERLLIVLITIISLMY